MDDRQTLLEQIRTSPLDDTVRLVYADWLDDHGSGDLDAATAEFIRVSCSRGGVVMPKPAYAWIHEHWKRLIPTAVAKFVNYRVIHKHGRTIFAEWEIVRGRPNAVRLSYSRGFITRIDAWAPRIKNNLLPSIRYDQPLTGLHISERAARRRSPGRTV